MTTYKPITVKISPEFQRGMRVLMSDSGISQSQLAAKAGLERHWVNQVLVGRRATRVSKDFLELAMHAMHALIEEKPDSAAGFKKQLDQIFGAQLGFEAKMKAKDTWTASSAVQNATDMFAGMSDDCLTKAQMTEVVGFLQALVGGIKDSTE